ncbi:MAG: RNA polymerase sigma factor [Candidatus Doudnabacteria bacterium]|nr:RNA polymerase sigma factor [Candidatus Doudnabacteria bacterium]
MDANVLELVTKVKNGNKEAFGTIYDIFAPRLLRFIKLKVQSQEQAEDILQESLIKAWRNLHSFELGEGGSFQAWVYKITANCINDYFRKIYRSPNVLELNENIDKASSENLERQVGNRLETESIKRVFKELPENYRMVLELRFVQDLSLDETAGILGKNNLTIRVLQHRALKRLKAILK